MGVSYWQLAHSLTILGSICIEMRSDAGVGVLNCCFSAVSAVVSALSRPDRCGWVQSTNSTPESFPGQSPSFCYVIRKVLLVSLASVISIILQETFLVLWKMNHFILCFGQGVLQSVSGHYPGCSLKTAFNIKPVLYKTLLSPASCPIRVFLLQADFVVCP